MENANKIKVVKDIAVLDCSTPYMFEQTKKYIADKYKGLGIADDAMLANLWENVEVDYAQNIYPTVVDFDLPEYDIDTVNAAFDELGVLYGKCTENTGNLAYAFNLNKKVDQLPVVIGDRSNEADLLSLEILANYDRSSDKGTTLYTSIGWCDSRKDEEVAEETLQQGEPFLWSFVNWVKVYIGNSLNIFQSSLGEFFEKLEREFFEKLKQGIFNRLEVETGNVKTVIEKSSDKAGSVLKFNFIDNNKDSAFFLTYDERGQPSYKGTRLVFDPKASPYTGNDQSGVYIIGAKDGDVLMATGGYSSFANLFNSNAPTASTTKKGAVKMAGKVDALAEDATLAQAVERLNTLIANLKSAGIMSGN